MYVLNETEYVLNSEYLGNNILFLDINNFFFSKACVTAGASN